MSHLDKAIRELSVLNDLASEIGGARTVEEIIRSIVRKARISTGAVEGDITLVSNTGERAMSTLVRTRTDRQASRTLRPTELLLHQMMRRKIPVVIHEFDIAERIALGLDVKGIKTLVCVPLLVGGRLIGILTVYNKDVPRNFSAEDVKLLTIMAAQSAQVVERARVEEERRAIIQTFGQFITPHVVDEILRYGTDTEGVRQRMCVLFMDVRGFTAFSEIAPPEEVVDYLRMLFSITIECVNRHHGFVHQLLGDGMMALFGAPVSHGSDATNAVAAALDMLHEVGLAVAAGEIAKTKLGIGLHAGEVVAGTIGSASHREYKVTGDVVNVAARIEQLNKDFDSTLLVSGSVYEALDPKPKKAVSLGSIPLTGRREPVQIYRLA